MTGCGARGVRCGGSHLDSVVGHCKVNTGMLRLPGILYFRRFFSQFLSHYDRCLEAGDSHRWSRQLYTAIPTAALCSSTLDATRVVPPAAPSDAFLPRHLSQPFCHSELLDRGDAKDPVPEHVAGLSEAEVVGGRDVVHVMARDKVELVRQWRH